MYAICKFENHRNPTDQDQMWNITMFRKGIRNCISNTYLYM